MRILHDFDYRRPATLAEALTLLAEHGKSAAPLAGGTDLLVNMKYRSILQLVPGAGTPDARYPAARYARPIEQPALVVSLAELAELRGVRAAGDDWWIGPSTTMTELVAAALPPALGALTDAAAVMGSPLIRNRATFGGNLINARPAADTAVALLALGGRVRLASAAGERQVDGDAFFVGPGVSARRPEELLVGIELKAAARTGSAYLRQGTRRQLEIALVGAAAWLALDDTGAVASARVALGAVGPTPLLAPNAAAALIGKRPDAAAIAAAAQTARGEARPIDDFRGSAAYRTDMIEVLVRRALTVAAERAAGAAGGAQ